MATLSLLLHEPLTARETVGLVERGEELGYHRAWFGELRGPDTLACAAACAGRTRRIELGTSIVSFYVHSPFSLAVASGTIADLGRRPFRLGIGAGGPAVVRRWHERSFGSPLADAGHAIGRIKRALSGDRVHTQVLWSGEDPVAVYLAALGPKMRDLGHAEADGVLTPFLTVERVSWLKARDAARPRQVELCMRLLVAVTDDPAAARSCVRARMPFYLASPHYRSHFARQGFEQEMADFLTATERSDRRGQVAAVSARLLDTVLVAGSPRECRARIDDYAAAGVDDLLITPFPELGQPVIDRTVAAVAPLAAVTGGVR